MQSVIRVEAGAERASTPIIRFDQVTKRFGAVLAVDDLSLEIRTSEFFCLLGPSGCGKSTLLRLLAGFEVPDRGRIELDGRIVTTEPPYRRPLNMMFQSYALFPHLTVWRNVAYGLRWACLPKADVGARVEEMLRLVRLEGLGDRYPAQISGGQRQRAALARALARRPRVLLLDEPLAALDRRLREETQSELKALQARLGTTFVMVTHDQAEGMSMADRIGVMDGGRLVQVAAPREVYERPASRFVATFLGDANILDGRVLGRNDGLLQLATFLSERPLRVALPAGIPVAVGEAAAIAIRPEKIRFLPDSDVRTENVVSGFIVEQTYLGTSTAYRLEVAGGQILRVLVPESATGPSRPPGPCRIGFEPQAAVLLR